MFFDLSWSREKRVDSSRENKAEADYTFLLIQKLINLGGVDAAQTLKKRIGVVTPYKGQVRLLRTKLDKVYMS